MFPLIKKELRLYWNSPIAYIFIIAFLGFSFWFFFKGFFMNGQVDMRSFFGILPWVYLFLIPAMTMRMWSEEYRQGTFETLMTSSLTIRQVVLGKFFATLFFLLIVLASTLVIPIILTFIGSLDWGVVLIGYLGAILLGATYIAIGLCLSAFTNNQIVAFIIAVVLCFALFIIGEPLVTYSMPGFLAPVFNFIGLGAHYQSIIRGVVDSRDIIYYLSMIVLFGTINISVLRSRR